MFRKPLLNSNFKSIHPIHQRIIESSRVIQKYPDRIPIICEKYKNTDIEAIDKNKYLVPCDITCGQFLYVIRKRLKLDDKKSIFLIINGVIPAQSDSLFNLYTSHKDKDGFLYVNYANENVFGTK